jgi:hypothetical protein
VEYRLLTIWRIDAPLEAVYAAIHDSPSWPSWWLGIRKVELLDPGDSDGIDSVSRYTWRGRLPYRLVFEVRATRIEKEVAIEGLARGDLEGVGRWYFARKGAVSIVRCEWYVRSTRCWMNLIAPLARPLFIHNHEQIMARGAKGLARRLERPLLSQKSFDLMAKTAQKRPPRVRWRRRWGMDPSMILVSGLAAGIIATLVQLFLWWLLGMPVLETLMRDSSLTAALVMGPDALPPRLASPWAVLPLALLIHFALAVIYAAFPTYLVSRLTAGPLLVSGALYGLAIYLVNLHGLTGLFPWFEVSRGGITLVTHLVFGVALAAGCLVFARLDAGFRMGAARRVTMRISASTVTHRGHGAPASAEH